MIKISIKYKKLFQLIILLYSVSTITCQENKSLNDNFKLTNSISFELLGNTTPYSINYEKIFKVKGTIFSGRIGVTTLPVNTIPFYDYRTLGILTEFSCLIPFSRHVLEFGNGLSYLFLFDNIYKESGINNSDIITYTPRIGYRLYNKKFTRYLKIGFTPLIFLDVNEKGDEYDNQVFIPFGGIAYGFMF